MPRPGVGGWWQRHQSRMRLLPLPPPSHRHAYHSSVVLETIAGPLYELSSNFLDPWREAAMRIGVVHHPTPARPSSTIRAWACRDPTRPRLGFRRSLLLALPDQPSTTLGFFVCSRPQLTPRPGLSGPDAKETGRSHRARDSDVDIGDIVGGDAGHSSRRLHPCANPHRAFRVSTTLKSEGRCRVPLKPFCLQASFIDPREHLVPVAALPDDDVVCQRLFSLEIHLPLPRVFFPWPRRRKSIDVEFGFFAEPGLEGSTYGPFLRAFPGAQPVSSSPDPRRRGSIGRLESALAAGGYRSMASRAATLQMIIPIHSG